MDLTQAQEQARAKLREACAMDYRENPQVIVVQGFSGSDFEKCAKAVYRMRKECFIFFRFSLSGQNLFFAK